MGRGTPVALAVLVALAPPVLAEEPDAGRPAVLERICGWVDGPEALDPRTEGGEDALAADCRAVLRCLPEARRSPPAGVEAVCDEVLALPPDDIRGFVEVLEVGAPASEPCVGFLRCLLESPAPWRDEFARICGRTEDAASLPRHEIEELIRASGALLERIEGLGIPEAKVYIFRLEKCRAFFEYSLELQELRDEGAAGDG